MSKQIPYGRQSISSADVVRVGETLRGDFLTTGPEVSAFEAELCRVTGAPYAVACSNGTAALHLAALALRLDPGSLGVTSPITFLASANCMEYVGGRVGFVDIDEARLCLDPRSLETYCREVEVPEVVIPVSFAGVPADLPAIRALSRQWGFRIIEDAAHALGSRYRDGDGWFASGSCAHSDMAILSFHPVKTITTGEGGAVTTADEGLYQRLLLLRNHGMEKNERTAAEGGWAYEMHEPGYNYRITDLQCALGRSQLERLEAYRTRRQELFLAYQKAFADVPGVILPPWPENTDPCHHLYVIRFVGGTAVRRMQYDGLRALGILPQVHYIPVHLQPYYRRKYGYGEGLCPRAETYYTQCLSLPLYPDLSDEDQRRVVTAVRNLLT